MTLPDFEQVTEQCDGYDYCAHPNSPSCEVGPHPPRPNPSRHQCPTRCNSSSTKLLQFKAASAYAVATPGDVPSIQKEILAHGPIQVGFQVFSDFMQYHNGTYSRTAGAQGPLGGHAVKIVGESKSPLATENQLGNTDGIGAPHQCSLGAAPCYLLFMLTRAILMPSLFQRLGR